MPTQLNPVADGLPVVPVANAADATGNYVVPGNTNLLIRVNNASGSSVNVTLTDPTTVTPEGPGVTLSRNPVIPVAAAASRYILLNKARRARFIDPATGRVSFLVSLVTSVTVEVLAV